MRAAEIQAKMGRKDITIYRVNNDINGNPRYVMHFINLDSDYERAVRLIKTIGGTKYRAKWFGGGVVFSSYNVEEDLKRINWSIK